MALPRIAFRKIAIADDGDEGRLVMLDGHLAAVAIRDRYGWRLTNDTYAPLACCHWHFGSLDEIREFMIEAAVLWRTARRPAFELDIEESEASKAAIKPAVEQLLRQWTAPQQ